MRHPNDPRGEPLTPREQEILALLTAGESTREIAARLGIGPGTVETHVRRIYRKIGAQPARVREGDALSPRELEVLALVAAGDSTLVIADQLGITAGTVKAHLTSIYKKLRVQNRVQAARYYLDHLAPRSDA
jgi:DNA-binding CsgD family transcriptional regulator